MMDIDRVSKDDTCKMILSVLVRFPNYTFDTKSMTRNLNSRFDFEFSGVSVSKHIAHLDNIAEVKYRIPGSPSRRREITIKLTAVVLKSNRVLPITLIQRDDINTGITVKSLSKIVREYHR